MKKQFGFAAFLSLSLVVPFVGCGGGSGNPLAGGGEQTLTFGNLITRLVGTAQQPVTSAGSGATVTGVAGALINSLTLAPSGTNPNLNKIVFHSHRDGNWEIYTMNADGKEQNRLTNHPDNDDSPSLSPDGSKIAFMSDRNGSQRQIYSMNVDGSGLTQLTYNGITESGPTWSPNGSKIAFIGAPDGNGNWEIYTINADGTDQKRLTNNEVSEYDPVWSPDGSKIAFVSNQSGTLNIYTMNTDGTGISPLVTGPHRNEHPVWSPDGSKIAFTSSRDGNAEIYVRHADGTQQRLTENIAADYLPSWSPDGSKIAFTSTRDGNDEIYTMNVDGSSLTRLTNHNSEDVQPRWPTPPARQTLVGTGGKLAPTAAGFLYGRKADQLASLLTFDTQAASRPSVRVATTTGIAQGLSNYTFTITSPAALTHLGYLNGTLGKPTTVIGAGSGLANISGVLVDYNANTGTVSAVLPYDSTRAAGASPPVSEQNAVRVLRGHFLGAWDNQGQNRAPHGATEVQINARTGEIVAVR